jgi:hypothetical protein
VYQTILFERTKCHLLDWGALYEHHTNLVVQNLFKMGIMGKIENVLQNFYDCFFIILKEQIFFVKLANMVETKGGCYNFVNIKSRSKF